MRRRTAGSATRTRTRRSQYLRAEAGLLVVGGIALAGGVAFPDALSVLFGLGAIGVFGGLLSYYLTPERFIAASVGEAVYDSLAATAAAIVVELGLRDDRVYVPLESETAKDRVRLFIAQHAPDTLPGRVVAYVDLRGHRRRVRGWPRPVADWCAGLQRVRGDARGAIAADPGTLADKFSEGLVEDVKLVRSASADIEDGQATIGLSGSAFGSVDRIDHPVVSFLAVGFGVGLPQPVTVTVDTPADDHHDALVTCMWPADALE